MSYIGNQSQTAYSSLVKQDITGNGGTGYTLSYPVSNENDILLYINNVKQEGGSGKAFTASGTTLTLSEAIANTDSCYVQYIGLAVQTVTPPDASVGTAKIADDAVSTAKIADSAVSTAKIASSAVNLTSKVTGVLPVANGGTGSSSFTGSTMTLATTQSTTSGEDKDFMSIPSGTKRITIMFNGVGNANASALIRLGTSSGLTTSGYVSSSSWGSSQVTDTSGFIVYGTAGSSAVSGILTICHMGSNLFVASHAVRYNGSNSVFGGGHVQLGGTLDRLRVQGVSGGAFNSGSINVMYES